MLSKLLPKLRSILACVTPLFAAVAYAAAPGKAYPTIQSAINVANYGETASVVPSGRSGPS